MAKVAEMELVIASLSAVVLLISLIFLISDSRKRKPSAKDATNCTVSAKRISRCRCKPAPPVKHDAGKTKGTKQNILSAFFNQDDKAMEKEVDSGGAEEASVTVLFGTQTGTAEMFSKSLVKKLKESFGSKAQIKLVDLGDYDPANLTKENIVLFLVATYGEGDPTDNAMDFVEWTRAENNTESNMLQG